MFVIYEPGKIPIKVWLKKQEDLEDGCFWQAKNLSMHPIVKYLNLMPDSHQGYGMPIGGVIGCENAVIPNAVGVDIGCGMGYIKFNIKAEEIKKANNGQFLKNLVQIVERTIPIGFTHHKEPQDWEDFNTAPILVEIIGQELNNARYQLGTLGGGNHFIEFQECEDGLFAIMLHSGSRNFGKKICDYFNKKAKELNAHWHSKVDPSWDLAFLPEDSFEGHDYITAMNYALDFARENRYRMMERVKEIFLNLVDKFLGDIKMEIISEVNIHHNYAAKEHHYGKDLWIHRKGAIRMRKGELGIIPGSMGTPSYIVEGLGNPESLCSASHGAGRCMGRMEASRTFTKEEVNKSMQGIIFSGWGKNRKGNPDYGEAPGAYKDIDEVIENEKDLVKVIEKLRPLAVVKAK